MLNNRPSWFSKLNYCCCCSNWGLLQNNIKFNCELRWYQIFLNQFLQSFVFSSQLLWFFNFFNIAINLSFFDILFTTIFQVILQYGWLILSNIKFEFPLVKNPLFHLTQSHNHCQLNTCTLGCTIAKDSFLSFQFNQATFKFD